MPLARRYRPVSGNRGLAEIVGTLMLVLIVVAAAISFSLFVASYQTQVQNEQRAAHERALEGFHVLSATPTVVGSTSTYHVLTLVLVGADVNYMNISGIVVNGSEVNYTFTLQGRAPATCTWPATTVDCTMVPPFQTVTLVLASVPGLSLSAEVLISLFTKLANEFSYVFVPPVAIADVYFVNVGASSAPVFDGSRSVQPTGGINATIVSYRWTIVNTTGGHAVANGTGQQLEESALAPHTAFDVYLNVTNSIGLIGSVNIAYNSP